ncbi:uncharacterized protein LAJ45_00119 [Morchella importuna]|uniref:uncharacterized protein n=1 Tax=Morchella importuna TaxID=1174673 RepID=UPI001E8EB7C7|nr:uncharacterized protein LAJ45_00119 [Morchella importuna]KAH8155110.1 hypothetical protein LAJ45_00119 [Morchella importuna]
MSDLRFRFLSQSLNSIRVCQLIIIFVVPVHVSSTEYNEITDDGTTVQDTWKHADVDKCEGFWQEVGSLGVSDLCYKSNDQDYRGPTKTSLAPNDGSLNGPPYPIIHYQGPACKRPKYCARLTRTLPDPNAIKSIDFLEFPPWYHREPPPHPGITVLPAEIPEGQISTFLGSLGHARSKGFVIPVNKEGVPGWEKRSLEKESVVVLVPESTGSGFVTSTKVLGTLVPTAGTIGGQTIHTPIPHRIKPFYGQTLTASTISNKPSSSPNSPFKESIKLASIQAFSQMGIVLIALLIITGVAVVFICVSSILKFPIPFLGRLKFGNIKKGAKKLKSQKTDTRDINFEDLVGNATLNPYARARYLRGTAEAINDDSSLQDGSQISGERTEKGISEDNTLAVATGSQSKLTGVKLRRTRSC